MKLKPVLCNYHPQQFMYVLMYVCMKILMHTCMHAVISVMSNSVQPYG